MATDVIRDLEKGERERLVVMVVMVGLVGGLHRIVGEG
jgi:hypothetical protein